MCYAPYQTYQKPHTKSVEQVFTYFLSLFPILGWIGRYNLGWLTGDVIAGLTVGEYYFYMQSAVAELPPKGMVVVPQGMSYAKIATLPAEYGLYSSFVGVLIYCVRPLSFPPRTKIYVLAVFRNVQRCLYWPSRRHVPHRC